MSWLTFGIVLLADQLPSNGGHALSLDYWIDKGVMGAILGVIVWFIVKIAWDAWNFVKPMLAEKHKSTVALQDTLTTNSSKQTEILGCLKDSMSEHSKACIAQSAMELETVTATCRRLKTIEVQVDNHTAAAEMAVYNLREIFRDYFPELAKKVNIEDKCNDMLLVLRNSAPQDRGRPCDAKGDE